MRLTFTPIGWENYQYWVQTDRKMLARVNELIREASRSPFRGIGKPEPLKGDLQGWWSRRIDLEHRLVYRVTGTADTQSLEIAACRFHYQT